MLFRYPVVSFAASCVLLIAAPGCSASGGEASSATQEAIVSGSVVTDPSSPFLYMNGPQGSCTATLVAPNLVVTARHCAAATPEGPFTCTSTGDLVMTGTSGGQIGTDDSPSSLSFYTNARLLNGTLFVGAPDGAGAMILSTNTPTSCRDDIAFIILQQPIAGVTPATIRIDLPTQFGESVSAWGYGLTAEAGDPLALRVRSNATIAGVGYDVPTTGTQLAPLRAVRVGPDDITCNGDSGGPITSNVTGAVVAIASLGAEASATLPACTGGGVSDTTGPRLGAYQSLAALAFSAAGATPILEPGAPPLAFPADAGLEAGDDGGDMSDPPEAGAEVTTKNVPPEMPTNYRAAGGSCSAAPGHGSPFTFGVAAVAVAALVRRRRAGSAAVAKRG